MPKMLEFLYQERARHLYLIYVSIATFYVVRSKEETVDSRRWKILLFSYNLMGTYVSFVYVWSKVQRFHSSSGSFLPSVLLSEARYTSSILALFFPTFCSVLWSKVLQSHICRWVFPTFCSVSEARYTSSIPALVLSYLLFWFWSKVHQSQACLWLFSTYCFVSEARYTSSIQALFFPTYFSVLWSKVHQSQVCL